MKSLEQLEHEYETLMYYASGLTQDHQQTMRNALIRKAQYIKEEIQERENLFCEKYKQLKLSF
jgi:hypothetical protein